MSAALIGTPTLSLKTLHTFVTQSSAFSALFSGTLKLCTRRFHCLEYCCRSFCSLTFQSTSFSAPAASQCPFGMLFVFWGSVQSELRRDLCHEKSSHFRTNTKPSGQRSFKCQTPTVPIAIPTLTHKPGTRSLPAP